MAHRGTRYTSATVVIGLVLWLAADVASQSPAAVFKPDYESRCPCDHTVAESLLAYPQCSLCLESEFHNPAEPFYFVADIDPGKPNRWLILPRAHDKGMQDLTGLSADTRIKFWAAAIRKGAELWGEQWGLAVNGELARSQCHAHVHIGKLLDGVEGNDVLYKTGRSRVPGRPPITVRGPDKIKVPGSGAAYWIHKSGNGLHVHVEDRTALAESVLMR
jgi:hypothetical protein